MSKQLVDDFDLDFSPRDVASAKLPHWYYDDAVPRSFKDIAEVALRAFDEKLRFIQEMRPGLKVNIKRWKLVVASLNKDAGLNPGYLRNLKRPDVGRTVDFISSLNSRLEVAVSVQQARYSRRPKQDPTDEVRELRARFRKLEELKLADFAKAAFEHNMAHRLEATRHGYSDLLRENMRLREERVSMAFQIDGLTEKLVGAHQEINRLKAQLKSKGVLKVS